jgi:exodeoxyribonuclease VII small subunit
MERANASADDRGPAFDDTLRELQAIVERLERGELSLEESLRAFERGVELSRRGQAILDAAERRVELLLRDGRTEPFADKGEAKPVPGSE